jgi:hypothetical protein
MIKLNGQKNSQRRIEADITGFVVVPELGPDTGFHVSRAFKTTPTFVTQVLEPFEVDTLEGVHTGKAGDYLAIGIHGEMYPIDKDVFDATYEVREQA